MSEIESALTPDEWKRLGCERGPAHVGWFRDRRPDGYGPEYMTVSDGDDKAIVLEPVLHAVAALALHGQSFGFTQEDVRACRNDLNEWVEDREKMLRDLAGRIAALLPPREP